MADGRIQPAKIEEIVARTRRDVDKIILEEGTKLCHEVGVYNLHADIVQLLGRFKYRFSYGQSMIAHTLEETKIGLSLAHELKADVNVVRLGCLLHDIGKVITEEEGSHVDLGVKFLRKFGIPEEVIACVAEHHEDKEFSSRASMVVYVADAISGSRPGARYEDLAQYLKRLDELEGIGKSFKGVDECYAFQAGRELRVIVNPDKVSDDQAVIIAQEMKEKIEDKIKNFPGQIRITVIREKRFMATAK
jgi:ribonuclease Y